METALGPHSYGQKNRSGEMLDFVDKSFFYIWIAFLKRALRENGHGRLSNHKQQKYDPWCYSS